MENRIKNLLDLRYDLALDLYRQRIQAHKAKSKGLESLVYTIFGSNNIGSICLALDPYWQFNDSLASLARSKGGIMKSILPVRVVPVNRKRLFACIPGGDCVEHTVRRVTGRGAAANFVGPPTFWAQGFHDDEPLTFKRDLDVFSQPTLFGYCLDTTYKSRNPQFTDGQIQASKRPVSGVNTEESVVSVIGDLFKDPDRKLIPDSSIFNPKEDVNAIPLADSNQGELELFIPTIDSYSSSCSFMSDYTHLEYLAAVGDNLINMSEQIEHKEGNFTGPTTVVSKDSVEGMSSFYRARCLNGMARNLPKMLPGCLPERTNYNLIYQIFELKDIPAQMRSTIKSWQEIETVFTKVGFKLAQTSPKFWTYEIRKKYAELLRPLNVHIDPDKSAAEAWLNFKFGWQSVYQALVGLLSKPADATKEVNRLIARNGLDTTLSSTRFEESFAAYTPDLSVAKSSWEYDDPDSPSSMDGWESIKYRCVVNSNILFPKLDIPLLRTVLFLKKIGLIPTPSDLYNLVPWTWLIDWFAGLGDYLKLMQEINDNNTIINYGFMSAHVKASWTVQRHVKTDTYTTVGKPWEAVTSKITDSKTRTGVMNCKFILRRSIGSIASIAQYNGDGLTDSQRSILFALLSVFSPGARSGKRWSTTRV